MSRCVACDTKLKQADFKHKKPDGSENDLCKKCNFFVKNPLRCDPIFYQFEGITSGITKTIQHD